MAPPAFLTARRALAVCALALAACAGPAAPSATPVPPTPVPPSATPPPAPTVTPLPTTAGALPATSVRISSPSALAFDPSGNLYATQCDVYPSIVRIDSLGLLTIFAGTGIGGYSGDKGPATAAELACPYGLAFDRDGNLFVADTFNDLIRRIDRDGIISTHWAGSLRQPTGLAFDEAGNLYVADNAHNRIQKIDLQGKITTFAGTGLPGFSGDGGPAAAAMLNLGGSLGAKGLAALAGIVIDPQGDLYVSDVNNARVRKVDRQGVITTIAGTGQPGFAGDGGPALAAQLNAPTGLAFGPDGSLYVASVWTISVYDNRVRRIDPNGIITTVAGGGGGDFSADGKPAISASLREPCGLAFDSLGNLYIAEFDGERIRRVDTRGIITTIAGGAP